MNHKKSENSNIRNSTAEFLIFTHQSGENSISVHYEDNTIWLTQKLMSELFEVSILTISDSNKIVKDFFQQLKEPSYYKNLASDKITLEQTPIQ